jgi:hypothetical protein
MKLYRRYTIIQISIHVIHPYFQIPKCGDDMHVCLQHSTEQSAGASPLLTHWQHIPADTTVQLSLTICGLPLSGTESQSPSSLRSHFTELYSGPTRTKIKFAAHILVEDFQNTKLIKSINGCGDRIRGRALYVTLYSLYK